MVRDTSLGCLPLLGKSSASLGMVGWEALGEQWHDMASQKSHKCCTVMVPIVAWLTVFWKEWQIIKQHTWALSCK